MSLSKNSHDETATATREDSIRIVLLANDSSKYRYNGMVTTNDKTNTFKQHQ